MDDAYTIGITLALDNGVSEGLAIIRRDLEMLNRAVSQTMGGLAGLRRAGDAAVGGPALDLARLTAEGQRLLGRLPNVMAPAPPVRSRPSEAEAAEPAAPAVGAAVPRPAPASPVARSPARDPAVPPPAIRAPQPMARAAPLPPAVPAGLDGPAAPSAPLVPARSNAPVASVASAASGPIAHAAAGPELPSRLHFLLSPASTPPAVPMPAASAAPVPSATPSSRVSAAPVPPAAVAIPATGIAPTLAAAVPWPRVSAAPAAAERPGPTAAPLAPPARALAAADFAALARALTPVPAPGFTPTPARLAAFAASAMPVRVPAAAPPERAVGSGAERWPELPENAGRRMREPWADTAISAAPIRPAAPGLIAGPGLPDTAPSRSAEGSRAIPEEAAEPQDRASIHLDGHAVGRWLSEHLAREAGRAPAGPTGFDPRAGIVWPGAPIQS